MQGRKMRTTVAALAGTVLATTLLGAAPLSAAPAEQHCVVRVVGQRASGELRTTTPECGTTRTAALKRADFDALVDVTLGYHFDGFNLTGGSFSVIGADCTGGWLNLPPEWINRVSSTLHGLCGHIRHFDGYNLISPNQMTVDPGGNLAAALNNKTNSLQYLP